MKDGTNSKTATREIISVSLPVQIYDLLEEVCDHYHMNRSAFVAGAIADYLRSLGLKVGEE